MSAQPSPRHLVNRRSPRRVALLVTIAGGGSLALGTQMIYPVLLPHLRADYGLDFTTGGLLLTVVFFSNGLFQFPSGLIADAIGERYLMTVSAVFCAVSVVIVVMVPSLALLFVATGLLGVGISAFTLGRMSLLPKTFPDNLGAASGLTFGSGDAGRAALPAIAGLLAAGVGWQLGFAFTVPLFLAVGIASALVVPRAAADAAGMRGALSGTNVRTAVGEFRRPAVVLGTLIVFLFAGMGMSFSGFFPEYLVREKGLSAVRASLLFGALFGTGVVVKPVAGALFDRHGVRWTITGLASASVAGFVVLSQAHEFEALVVATVLVSFYLGSGTIGMSMILDALPDDVTATGIGILRTGTFSIASVGPVVVGLLADRQLFEEAILGLAVLPAVMVLLVHRFPPET